jgi:hypothetical protein
MAAADVAGGTTARSTLSVANTSADRLASPIKPMRAGSGRTWLLESE